MSPGLVTIKRVVRDRCERKWQLIFWEAKTEQHEKLGYSFSQNTERKDEGVYSDNILVENYGCESWERICSVIVGINYDLFNCKSGVSNNYHCSLSVYKYLCK